MRYFEICLPGCKPEYPHLKVRVCALSSPYALGCIVTEVDKPESLNFNMHVKSGVLAFEHYLQNANTLLRNQSFRRLDWIVPPGERILPREEKHDL